MKKFLLLTAGFAMALAAQAQTEVGFLDSGALGLADKPTLAEGTVLAETANVKMTNVIGDAVSAQNPDFQGFKTVIVNGEEITLVQGIGGSTNGTGNLDDGPTGGWMYRFEVKADGWLIVPSKISSNKNFYVYEGLIGEDPMPVAYTLGMDLQSKDVYQEIDPETEKVEVEINYADIPQIVFSLPADELGYVNREAADIDKYTFGGNTIAWPIRIATGNAKAATAGNGTGVIAFKVYAEAVNYLVFATGSKMNTCGYIFLPCDPDTNTPNISLYAPERTTDDGTVPEKTVVVMDNGGAGVSSVAADAVDVNAPVYNVLGQRVSKDAKGLLIQNGRKFYNR